MIGEIIITPIEVITVNRREQLYIFVKHEEFGYHTLYCVQSWVIFIIEVIDTHVFGDSEEKEERGEVTIRYDARETPILETN